MSKKANTILGIVGDTPLVKINKMNTNKNVEVYGKLEKTNPMGSVKDRIAKSMIEHAEKEGKISKDTVILEATSGNTGLGLAMVCAVKGYRLKLVMPDNVSMERIRMLTALGAEIVFTPGRDGMDGAISTAKKMGEDKKYFMSDQYDNKYNWLAHYETTAKEIWDATDGKITMFVAGMGTTGTLMGVSRRLKELKPDIKIVGVEPYPDHRIQGLKNMGESIIPGIYELSRIDEKINVRDEDAFETARLLGIREGIFSGMSSGAAMYVALQKAKKMKKGLIAVMLPDGGEKYLTTCLFDAEKCLKCVLSSEKPSEISEEYIKILEKIIKNKGDAV
ncbi:MAG: cysteine synthase family protein [Thermoplasmatales archaeon]|nr:cysteine synthase family protein [Thermoplasmatales archaeon]